MTNKVTLSHDDAVARILDQINRYSGAEMVALMFIEEFEQWVRADARTAHSELIEAALAYDALCEVAESGMTVIPFGEEAATFDAVSDRLRAAAKASDLETTV